MALRKGRPVPAPAASTPEVRFFGSPAELQTWFVAHANIVKAIWVGFYKTSTGRADLTWPQSVDEALCVGWIDGLRKSIDAERYMIRFTPRKVGSIWSAVNIARVMQLTREQRMCPAGLAAFECRRENRSGVYSYEQRSANLPPSYAALLAKNRTAAKFFAQQAPSYRRAACWWVTSAKQEATRLRRVDQLIRDCAAQRRLKQFI